MPTVRYQIRSEYGLAEPELYQSADKDDPEAILEGVAMAGLVGMLRQLGDLAEFAAQIFHNLHEEVMTTAARGHGMMLRVQQLEAEFPAIEKAFFSQSNHSNLAYNEGIDWHCNIQLNQNLLTHGDMPRFILDSYEECRGPPRLFTLDKFDVAGAGACLKRYTDPSFFKMELASSGAMEMDVLREKKGRKIKKKGSRWKNGQTLESLMSPKADSDLLSVNSNKVHDKTAIRVVKLKSKHRNGIDTGKSKRLMELLLEMHMDVQKAVVNDSRTDSQTKMESGKLDDSAVEVHDILVDTPDKYVAWENDSTSPTRKEATSLPADCLEHPIIENVFSKDLAVEPFSVVDENKKTPQQVSNKKFSTDLDDATYTSGDLSELGNSQKTASLEMFSQVVETEVSTDGYRSDDFGSEQENFVDAVNTMDSEIETDVECISKPDAVALITEAYSVGIDTEGLDDMQDHLSALDQPQVRIPVEGSVDISSTQSEPIKVGGVSNFPDLDVSHNTAQIDVTEEEVASTSDSNSDKVFVENHDNKSEMPSINAETAELAYSNTDQTCKDIPESLTFGSAFEDESQNSPITDLPSNIISSVLDLDTSRTLADVQLTDEELVANSDIIPMNSIGGSHDQEQVFRPSSDTAKTTCLITDNAFQTTTDAPILGSEVGNISESFSDTDAASRGISTDPRESFEEPLPFTNQMTESSTSSEGQSVQIDNDDTESAVHLCEQLPQGIPDGIEELANSGDELSTCVSETKELQLLAEPDAEVCSDEDNMFPAMSVYPANTSPVSAQSDGFDNEICEQFKHQNLELGMPSSDGNGTVEVADLDCSSFDIKDADFQENPCLDCHPMEQIAEAVPEGLHHEHLIEDISSDETKESFDVAAYMDAPSTVTEDIEIDFPNHLSEMKDDDGINDEEFGYWEHAPPPFTVSEMQTENDINACSDGVMISGFPGNEVDSNSELEHLDDSEVLDNHALLKHSPDSIFGFDVDSEDFGSTALQKELEDLTDPEGDEERPKENLTELLLPLHSEIEAENETLCNDTNSYLFAHTYGDLKNIDDEKLWVVEDSPDKNDMTVELQLHHDESFADNGTVGAKYEIPLQVEDENISVAETSYRPKNPEIAEAEEALLFTYDHSSASLQELSDSSLAASESGLPMKDSFDTGDSRLHNQNDVTILYRSDQIDIHPCVYDISENSLIKKEFSEAEVEPEDIIPCSFSDSSTLPIINPNSANLQEDAPAFIDSSLPLVPIHIDVSGMPESSEGTSSLNEDTRHGEGDSVISANLSVEPSGAKLIGDHNSLVSSECNGICMPIPNSGISGQLELDTSATDSNNFVAFPTLDLHGIGSEDPASCPFPVHGEVPPPLPPLPPLQWRTGKFQLGSLITDANLFQLATNSSMTSNMEGEAANGLLVEGSKGTQLEYQSATTVPTADAGKIEEDIILLHATTPQHSDLPLVSSSSAHNESFYVPDASERLDLPSPNLSASFSVSDSIITEHSPEKLQPVADNISQCGPILGTLNAESSQEHENNEVKLEAENALHPNDFLVGSVADNTHLHSSELSGDETLHLGQPLDFPPASLMEIPQLWYPQLLEQSEFSQFSILRKEDDERLTGKPLKIRNRPKDPLIEAVAAHDRSSLRKVSNLIQASDKPVADQRNSLLEQIRSKAFNLKPAAAAKQNIKGPSTNLKVAAIIEKANAIRQAFVGSDEDEDEDSWNDA